MKKYPVVFEQCNKLFEHCKNRELPSLLDQALFKFGSASARDWLSIGVGLIEDPAR